MKIIHTADIHLNSALKGFDRQVCERRREEIFSTYERMIEYAKTNGVEAIIIAGDMFDTQKISVRTKNRVLHSITSNPQIKFFYLAGNHDEDSFTSLLDSKIDNLFIFDNKWKSFKFDKVTITGAFFDSTNQGVLHDSLNLDENTLNIVVMHGQIAGYNNKQKAEIISLPRLKDKGIDYLALGHYHSYTEGKIDLRGKYVYSGCLEGRGFDETGEKGFVLLEIFEKNIVSKFIPFASRELKEIEYLIDGNKSWYENEQDIICLCQDVKPNSLVKVEIQGEKDIDYDVNVDSLKSKLERILFFVKIVDKTTVKIKEKDFLLDKSIRGEFYRVVMQSNLPEQLKDKVLLCGINALKGDK